ncbi:MAG: cyclic nucleotide-binding domain-containing protein [Bacteroidales bacterium]
MHTERANFLEDRVDFLREVEVFADIENNILEKIADVMNEKRYVRQESIVKKGQIGEAMYIIMRGEVRVHDRGHVHCRMGSKEIFGEYSLFDEETRSASVTAEKVTYVLELKAENFAKICDQYTEVTRGVLMRLIRRMRERNVLEEKLAKSYIRIQKQKAEIEAQNESIQKQKKLLEQQNYDLISLNEDKNKTIGLVVHGLKNPLTTGKCLTEMMLDDSTLKEEHRESLEIINNSMDRVNRLITQSLNLNTIEAKVYKPKREKIDLKKTIEEIWKNYSFLFDNKKIESEIKLEQHETYYNRVFFSQIIDHLIANSLDRSGVGQKISLDMIKEDDYLWIKISDEGEKIDEDNLKKLFSDYKRQHTKVMSYNNINGLSMAIVHKYTIAMEGNVDVTSKKGKTTFSVKLPLTLK